MSYEILISHQHNNADAANAINEFLNKCGIPKEYIFCSSLPGQDVKTKIDNEIFDAFSSSKLVIVLFSNNYLRSYYCINEAGICWYLDKLSKEHHTFIIATDDLNVDDMVGFLDKNYILHNFSDPLTFNSLYKLVKQMFDINVNSDILNKLCISCCNTPIYKDLKTIKATKSFNFNDLTDNELFYLYYSVNIENPVFCTSDLFEWLIENEYTDFNLEGGYNLLKNFGWFSSEVTLSSDSYVVTISPEVFRELCNDTNKQIMSVRLESHRNLSSDRARRLINGNITKHEAVFLYYLFYNNKSFYGVRSRETEYREKYEIFLKVHPVFVENIDYLDFIDFLVSNKFVLVDEKTSYGNPRLFKLKNSIRVYIEQNRNKVLEILKSIIWN